MVEGQNVRCYCNSRAFAICLAIRCADCLITSIHANHYYLLLLRLTTFADAVFGRGDFHVGFKLDLAFA